MAVPGLVARRQAPRGRRLPGTHASLGCADDRHKLYQPSKRGCSGPCLGSQSPGHRFLRGYYHQTLASRVILLVVCTRGGILRCAQNDNLGWLSVSEGGFFAALRMTAPRIVILSAAKNP